MGNERKLRLIQVAKEFKVGLNTITDFLQKKGMMYTNFPKGRTHTPSSTKRFCM